MWKQFLTLIIVCKIFSFGSGGELQVGKEIENWLVGKKVVSVTQSSYGLGAEVWTQEEKTYITIIAEYENPISSK